MVDWIADAFNWTQIAEFLRICVPEETQNHGPGEPCAKDNQCANHTLFPDGQWCDRDGKISMGLLCVGACSPRYDPGEQVPLLKKAACKSNKEICGMCTEIGEEVVPMNSSCTFDGQCGGDLFCFGKGLPCSGKCSDLRQENETCNMNGNCAGDLTCTCGVCRQDEDGQVPDEGSCKSDQQCGGTCSAWENPGCFVYRGMH